MLTALNSDFKSELKMGSAFGTPFSRFIEWRHWDKPKQQ